jgi:hypothetical protein
VVVAPAFAPDASVLALVISVMVPSNWQTITKTNPLTGEARSLRAATWTAHHELAYFRCATAAFTGPFDLGDAPSLPRCTAVASNRDLYVWTAPDPNHAGPGAPWPSVVPQLAVYPLGSSVPRLSLAAPGRWPDGEPVVALDSGDVVRLMSGATVERYTAATGVGVSVTLPQLQLGSARPPVGEELHNGACVACSSPIQPSAGLSSRILTISATPGL